MKRMFRKTIALATIVVLLGGVFASPSQAMNNSAKYTYVTRYLDCSSASNWYASAKVADRNIGSKMLVAKSVLSYKNVKVQVPKQGPGNAGYTTKTVRLPYKVQYKYHSHTYNMGFGSRWIYRDNSIVIINSCNCGYRAEVLQWEIPG
jgi:hypothetical protein